MSRKCFACSKRMTLVTMLGKPWFRCSRCDVAEAAEQEPARQMMPSWIDSDTGEEVLFFDHSSGFWPSPG